jgi:predicted nucleotidyltransferase component of viral defense system
MLDPDEAASVEAAYGVPASQVHLDHMISHILAAIAGLDLPLTFFGGTALARTHLADPAAGGRLSEDIDLYSSARREVAATLDEHLPRLLRREYPRARWDPPLSAVRAVAPGHLVSEDGLRVRIQLLDSQNSHQDLARWPTEIRTVHLRYTDTARSVQLRVPTLPAAAAMKTAAWIDRKAARDLYDLAGLARIGALTNEAATLFRHATGLRITPHMFDRLPASEWKTQLAHQTRDLPPAQYCLAEVREAYSLTLGWNPPADTDN